MYLFFISFYQCF